MRYILIVEDEPEIRYSYEHLFDPFDYEVTAVANGKEATRLIKRQPFDIVITDYRMPWVDGGELYHRIRKLKEYEDLPIIFVTGYSSEISSNILHDKRVTVMHKPVESAKLVETVNTYMKEIEARRQQVIVPKVDIELIDAYRRTVEDLMIRMSGMENVESQKPFVKKTTDRLETDVGEVCVIYSPEITAELALLFRRDTYLWITSIVGSANYQTIERALELQGGTLIKDMQKGLWKRLDIVHADPSLVKVENVNFHHDIYKPRVDLKAPVFAIPFKSGFGEFTAVLKAKRVFKPSSS